MDIQIEDFSLRRFRKQFCEFNSAVRDNRAHLIPYFWWARENGFVRFKFILSGILAEYIARVSHELPYNKKFIIRSDGKFAGIIGLDDVAQNAPRAEVWCFVTDESKRRHIASTALKWVENFARMKSIDKIYARTSRDNRQSQYLLCRNGYNHYYPTDDNRKYRNQLMWYKYLNDKIIEK